MEAYDENNTDFINSVVIQPELNPAEDYIRELKRAYKKLALTCLVNDRMPDIRTLVLRAAKKVPKATI